MMGNIEDRQAEMRERQMRGLIEEMFRKREIQRKTPVKVVHKKRRLPIEERQNMAARYIAGEAPEKLAEEFMVHCGYVITIGKAQIRMNMRIEAESELKTKVIGLYRELQSVKLVSEALRLKRGLVQRFCEDVILPSYRHRVLERKREILESPAPHTPDPSWIALRSAHPDGSTCTVKACPFPALVDGKCRTHYLDRASSQSIVGSSSFTAIQEAHLLSW